MLCLFVGEDSTSPGLPLLALALMLTDSDLLAPSGSWHRSTPGRTEPKVSWPTGFPHGPLDGVNVSLFQTEIRVHSSFAKVYLPDESVQVQSLVVIHATFIQLGKAKPTCDDG